MNPTDRDAAVKRRKGADGMSGNASGDANLLSERV
jgi:hypothetical protein